VVECDKARKSFAIYYMPHNVRLTATRVALVHCRYHTDAKQKRALRTQAFEAWESVTCAPMLERLAA
jgi:hypothetical protein